MKKVVATVLSLCLLITAVMLGVFALPVSAATSGGYTYTVSGGEATITDYSTSSSYGGAITIPSTLGGYPVTAIGEEAFYYCKSLTSVIIPDSVTTIGEWAFYECTSLTSITIGDSVTTIGDYAFRNCTRLTAIEVDENNTNYCSADGVLFNKDKTTLVQYPGGKSGAYSIPDSVTTIGGNAFYKCTSLTSITLPFVGEKADGSGKTHFGYIFGASSYSSNSSYVPTSLKTVVITGGTTIGGSAFRDCTSLTSITIGDSVTTIGDYAFRNCTRLTAIEVDENNTNYCSADGVLFNKDKTTLVQYPGGKSGAYSIPDSVTAIGSYAFYNCTRLTAIEVDENNTNYCSVDGVLFNKDKTTLIQCPGDKFGAYTIPDSVTAIGSYAFYNCTRLTSATIPDSVTSIRSYAFYNCTSLTSVTIGDSVTSIGEDAFSGCVSLTSIAFSDSVTRIYPNAFEGCSGLADVWYTGSSADRDKIYISASNGYFTSATWHYTIQIDNGHVYNNTCDTECNVCEAVRVPPHNYTDVCDTSCNLCGTLRTAPHAYDNACDNTCNVCGTIRDTDHVYDHGCDPDCNVCGETRNTQHVYTDDCDRECNHCNATRTAPHVYDNACDDECNACGFFRKVTHDYTAATCTEAKTCTVCGATSGSKLGHSYSKVVTKATATKNGTIKNVCTRCNYTASKVTTIYKASKISLSKTSFTYDGKVKKPTLTVKDSAGNTIASSNYTVKYASGCKNAGTYKVTVTFKGNYSGTKTLTYKINPVNVSKCTVSLSATSYTYDGSVKKPTVTVKNANGTKLTTSSYTVTYASGRKNVGTYKVTVKMKGNYTGTKTLTFKIIPVDISKCTVSLSKTAYTYNGKVQKPSVVVKDSKGKTISSSNYTVKYASGCKNVGTYKVTVTFKGTYSGTKTLTYKINPPKTAIIRVRSYNSMLAVYITKKATQVSGYEVQYSTKRSFSGAKSVILKGASNATATIDCPAGKNAYYVRVRTYKTVNGKKVYSGWSAIMQSSVIK